MTASATRIAFLTRIAPQRAGTATYRFLLPPNGYVERIGDGFRFIPVDWNTAL